MASKTAILSVRIISDAKKAVAGFTQAASGVDKLEKSLGKVTPFALAASGAVIALGKQALDSASALQQSTGAVESVFKSQADSIKALATDAANAVGLSANQYQEFASVMGSQLKNLGIAQQELVPTTDKLITMGADLASMYGGTTAEAVEALSAAFRGETDPIERYGIAIKQADVTSRMAKDGLAGLEGEALRQAEAQTILKMLTEQSADALGNFARETDTAAGSAQIAAAHWENAKAALGEQLLPIATQVAQKMADLAQRIGEHPQVFAVMAGAVLATTAAIFTLVGAVAAIQSTIVIVNAAKAAWAAWQASMLLTNIRVAMLAARFATMAAAAWVSSAVRTAAAWVASSVRTVAALAMQAAAFVAQNAAMMVMRGAVLAAAAAQWVLNAALAANPITLVVVAVAALIAVLVVVYNRCEAFRNAVAAARALGIAAFTAIAQRVSAVIRVVSSLISRAGGIGGIFRTAMSVAAGAVGVLMAPLNGLIGLISRIIGAISAIRFPSPPAWVSKFMAAPGPALKMQAAPRTLMAAGPATVSGGGILSGITGGGVVNIDNSVNINVDGSGIWDPRTVATQIRQVLNADARGRGGKLASGGSVIAWP